MGLSGSRRLLDRRLGYWAWRQECLGREEGSSGEFQGQETASTPPPLVRASLQSPHSTKASSSASVERATPAEVTSCAAHLCPRQEAAAACPRAACPPPLRNVAHPHPGRTGLGRAADRLRDTRRISRFSRSHRTPQASPGGASSPFANTGLWSVAYQGEKIHSS